MASYGTTSSSLTRIHLQALLILLLCLLLAGFAGYQFTRDLEQSLYQENVAHIARAAADAADELLTQQRQTLEKAARQPAVAGLLQHMTPAERDRKEDEIKGLLPGATAVHLLPRNNAGASYATEAIDPASLDYVRRAGFTDTPVAPEFHALGTTTEHYDLAASVRDATGKPLGHLLASFTPAPLRAVLVQSLSGGYLELQQASAGQASQTVMAIGEAPAGTATVSSSLGNSHWTLVYWPGDMPTALLAGNRIYYVGLMALALAAILVMLFRLEHRTVKAVRHDIRSLVRMFRDLRDGTVRVAYPMELKEFSEIFDYLRDRGKKLVEEKEKMKNMGLMDHLSQLSNRRHFEVRLKELFESSKTNGPSSVLIIDMDHFKQVNDKHGHDAGDALIVAFARALRKVVRQTDVLARLGGDEFCIIYAYASLDNAKVLADRLRKQLPREVALTKGVIHQLRWTGGLSAMHDKDAKPDDVLWRADQALLQAKEAGRNVTRVCDPVSGLPAKKQIIAG
ncbi:MAG: diguanylate cyclase domain-containing protein [Bacteroidota bacterium]